MKPIATTRAMAGAKPMGTGLDPASLGGMVCAECGHPESEHFGPAVKVCAVSRCACSGFTRPAPPTQGGEAETRERAQSRAWDAFTATNNHDRGVALRAGFDAGLAFAAHPSLDREAVARTIWQERPGEWEDESPVPWQNASQVAQAECYEVADAVLALLAATPLDRGEPTDEQVERAASALARLDIEEREGREGRPFSFGDKALAALTAANTPKGGE